MNRRCRRRRGEMTAQATLDAEPTSDQPNPDQPEESRWRRLSRRIDRMSDRRFALMLFLPAAVLILLIVLPPILAVFGMSLFRIELLKDGPSRFVGLGNITRMFADTYFVDSIPRTVLFAAGATIITVP